MRKHALLSASGASRWLTCTPSARLEETMPAQESTYADEGTVAHSLAELLILQKAYGVNVDKKLEVIHASEYYNEDMQFFCEEYAIFVVEKVRNAPAGAILVQEARLNLTRWIPEGFGHVDVCIISDEWLEVIDLKYGKGVPVDSYENKQMMVYGLGALEEYGLLYNIRNVRMTIYQPRIDNISSYEITKDNLIRWAGEVLRPGAIMAFQGIGDFIPGDHCRFCRVRPTCKANVAYNLALAAQEFDLPTITDEQVVKILKRADKMKNWINSVEELALRMAIEGKKWPGMKLVQGRSTRKYVNPELIEQKLIEAGYEGDKIVNKKLLGITDLSKKVSKLHFKEIVEPNLIKPQGAPTLTVEEDKRPDWNSTAAAALDFPDE